MPQSSASCKGIAAFATIQRNAYPNGQAIMMVVFLDIRGHVFAGGGILNSHRAASPLVMLVNGEEWCEASDCPSVFPREIGVEMSLMALSPAWCSNKRKGGLASFHAKEYVIKDYVRLASVENRIPKMISSYRRCRKCSRKGQEKRTRFMCAECDVPLCI
ncbi:hypothetical protein TNCV_4288041 [Trichonephila clavipes]|uniref:PiggyBac transposable element-derived protein 4 C-terminal zinc-ribbon domain-containing protein n=1 Tax=Trichonephila clavipes TaxID=2585209 RepID=A0A8X6VHD1_TRICX|nr:hypothetical protein TNCV_4288041 [Trichonephila clavipes]